MTAVNAELAGIRNYGDSAAEVSSRIAGAGAIDLAANIAALTPVFGAIGADFLAMFGVAQANHAKSVLQLAEHYGATAVAAHATAGEYEGIDDAIVANLGSAGGETV